MKKRDCYIKIRDLLVQISISENVKLIPAIKLPNFTFTLTPLGLQVQWENIKIQEKGD